MARCGGDPSLSPDVAVVRKVAATYSDANPLCREDHCVIMWVFNRSAPSAVRCTRYNASDFRDKKTECSVQMFLLFTLGLKRPVIGEYDCVRSAPFHPSIHNLGNVGPRGRVHASGAWFFTRLIDQLAYGGENMRHTVAKGMHHLYSADTTVTEVGCGTGTLTRELSVYFDHVYAVDTSLEMLQVARQKVADVSLEQLNAVDITQCSDVSIVCMMFHELPPTAQVQILTTLLNCTRGDVWIVDLDPSYVPSMAMLSGEPYVSSYLETIEATLEKVAACEGVALSTFEIIRHHVRGWVLKKNTLANDRVC